MQICYYFCLYLNLFKDSNYIELYCSVISYIVDSQDFVQVLGSKGPFAFNFMHAKYPLLGDHQSSSADEKYWKYLLKLSTY